MSEQERNLDNPFPISSMPLIAKRWDFSGDINPSAPLALTTSAAPDLPFSNAGCRATHLCEIEHQLDDRKLQIFIHLLLREDVEHGEDASLHARQEPSTNRKAETPSAPCLTHLNLMSFLKVIPVVLSVWTPDVLYPAVRSAARKVRVSSTGQHVTTNAKCWRTVR